MYNLKTRQICLFFIAFIPVTKVFVLPSLIAEISGSDSFLSCLLNGIMDLITLSVILFACKKYKTDFFTLMEKTLGIKGANFIYVFYAVVFFLKALIPVNDLRSYVEITLYETIPSAFYFLPFFILCFYFCSKPLRVLGRCSDIAWIFTSVGFLILFALSISHVDLTNLFPVGVNGINKIFSASMKTSLWYGDSVYLMFFIGNFLYKKKDALKIALSYLGGILIAVIFMVFFYTIFTSIAHRQTYSLTEISKYSTVINNIGRFDYIGIVLILFSNLFATSLPLYFSSMLICRVFKTQKRWITSLSITVALFITITVFREYFYSIEKLLLSRFFPLWIFAGNILPIILCVLPLKEKVNETVKA